MRFRGSLLCSFWHQSPRIGASGTGIFDSPGCSPLVLLPFPTCACIHLATYLCAKLLTHSSGCLSIHLPSHHPSRQPHAHSSVHPSALCLSIHLPNHLPPSLLTGLVLSPEDTEQTEPVLSGLGLRVKIRCSQCCDSERHRLLCWPQRRPLTSQDSSNEDTACCRGASRTGEQ